MLRSLFYTITLVAALVTCGCVSHKDLAQVEANSYDTSQRSQYELKVEMYIKDVLNQHFQLVSAIQKKHAMITRVEIQEEISKGVYEGYVIALVFVPGRDKPPRVVRTRFTATVDDGLTQLTNGGLEGDLFALE